MGSINDSSCSKCKLKYEGEVYMLSCTHNFCGTCVDTMRQDATITCHICTTKTNKDDVIKNTFIEKIAPFRNLIVDDKHKSIKCELCDPDIEMQVANNYCVECEQYMCKRCSRSHTRTKTTSTHSIVDKDDFKISVPVNTVPLCKEHNQDLKMFCRNCNTLICLTCCDLGHSSHCIDEELKEIFTESKLKTEKKIYEIDQLIQTQNIILKQNELQSAEFIRKINSIKSEIEARVIQIKKSVDEMSSQEMNKLTASQVFNSKNINKKAIEINDYIKDLNSYKMHLKMLVHTDSKYELFDLTNDNTKMNSLEIQQPKILSNLYVSFEENNEPIIFGYVKDSRNISLRAPLKNVSCIFGNEMYEADNENKCINIYDIDTMSYKSSINSWPDVSNKCIEQIIFINKTLFVNMVYCIYKYEIETNEFKEWKILSNCYISPSINSTILIRRGIFLFEYTVEGQELKTFKNFIKAYSAIIQLNNGNYIDTDSNEIMLLSASGRLIASFKINNFGKICTDGSKYVYYLIPSTGLITVLTIELKKIKEVKIENATNIFYDKENERIIVVTNKEIQYINCLYNI